MVINFKLWLTLLNKNNIVAYTNRSQKLDGVGKVLGIGFSLGFKLKKR